MTALRGLALICIGWAVLIVPGCGDDSPTSPTPALNVAGIWDVIFRGTVVQRNDGGAVGTPQIDSFVLSLQQSGTSVSGTLIYGEGRASELRIPLTATLTGTRLEYRVDITTGGCSLSIRADTMVTAAANGFSGSQTQQNCEGRAEGTVTGNKR
jgi:hypothetical protein